MYGHITPYGSLKSCCSVTHDQWSNALSALSFDHDHDHDRKPVGCRNQYFISEPNMTKDIKFL